MSLDRQRVLGALGEKPGNLFLALSRSGVPTHLKEDMQAKIEEYLHFLEDHLALEGSAEVRSFFQMDVAKDLAARWVSLLEHAEARADRDVNLLVATGVRYFVTPHDAESEIEVRTGYRDDAEVLAFVIQETGLPVEPLPLSRIPAEDHPE